MQRKEAQRELNRLLAGLEELSGTPETARVSAATWMAWGATATLLWALNPRLPPPSAILEEGLQAIEDEAAREAERGAIHP